MKKSSENVRVFLVDEHPLFLDGFGKLIDSRSGFECCGYARTSDLAMARIWKSLPDLVIIALQLSKGSGLDLLQMMQSQKMQSRRMVLTTQTECFFVKKAFELGATGYILKSDPTEFVMEPLERIMTGKSCFSPDLPKVPPTTPGSICPDCPQKNRRKLTSREQEVLHLHGEGKSNAIIGLHLHLSCKTISSHKENIKKKLHCSSGRDLFIYARNLVEESHSPQVSSIPRKD